MKVQKVLSYKNLPTKLPVQLTIIWWLLLDRLNAPEWGWAVSGTLLALFWITSVYIKFHREEPVELWN